MPQLRLRAGFALFEYKFVFGQGPWPFANGDGHSLSLVFVLGIISFKRIVCGIQLHWDILDLTAARC
jgi:hypothetical protein